MLITERCLQKKRWNINILLINGKFKLSLSPRDQGRMREGKEDGKNILCASQCSFMLECWLDSSWATSDRCTVPEHNGPIICRRYYFLEILPNFYFLPSFYSTFLWCSLIIGLVFFKDIPFRTEPFTVIYSLHFDQFESLTSLNHHLSEKDLELH